MAHFAATQTSNANVKINSEALTLLDDVSDDLRNLLHTLAEEVAAARQRSHTLTIISAQDIRQAAKALLQALTTGRMDDPEIAAKVQQLFGQLAAQLRSCGSP